ncbi:TetR/AcrR family transcriptional regulator [Burkholderia gladioli]|uniref:TetR/AcrR family transcriptional regulator n=1 Tax=Burkholderia gladioli TaxID=28095 RepID=UPI00164158B6|nr:TetR/AcrR family transcriptional regulator [Burkholderia gladioli]MBJ9675775.1 TetR/AcrR family transcriptional regulator [Burkholderia gladioli]MDN7464494.1 TetR/AcrR family transcriptional regulator [Burkholderia gladioli]
MKNQAGVNSSEKILVTATRMAQAHGYGGLNIRNLAEEVGIKAASLYHHFPGKAELAAAVARRYREDAAVTLDTLWSEAKDPLERLRGYPAETFRKSLENGNRMCLASFMTAEYDDLPDIVKKEAQAFADVNIEWLEKALLDADLVGPREAKRQARAIFAAVAGAQLVARGRSDLPLFDALINGYRACGLLPM